MCFSVTKFALAFAMSVLVFRQYPAVAADKFLLVTIDTPSSALAPADSYFGRFGMSVLGIRNAINDVTARIDAASSKELSALYYKLTMVNEAMLDLKTHYPRDSWLPDFGLRIAQAFARFPYHAAQIRANDTIDWIIADFPTTNQAFYASDLRRARLHPASIDNIPIEPILPSYAVPPLP
jgi:hypothetical protein